MSTDGSSRRRSRPWRNRSRLPAAATGTAAGGDGDHRKPGGRPGCRTGCLRTSDSAARRLPRRRHPRGLDLADRREHGTHSRSGAALAPARPRRDRRERQGTCSRGAVADPRARARAAGTPTTHAVSPLLRRPRLRDDRRRARDRSRHRRRDSVAGARRAVCGVEGGTSVSELASLSSVLDELAPAVVGELPDWADVLLRVQLVERMEPTPVPSRRRRSRSRRSRLYAVAAAAGVALVLVAAALATGGLHRFTSCLTGAPGKPAPVSDQQGFARRNAAAFARFPAGTKLRLLATTGAGGKRFNLLGFRDGESLCLRVVRADLPAGRGSTQRASLRELDQSAVPAVVVSDVWFSFGKPATSADGIYGFADDSVQKVEIIREHSGVHAIRVSSNAFLSLTARPSGTVANRPAPDLITGVFAVLRNGTRIRLAYVSAGGVGTQAPPPKPPFYHAAPRTSLAQIPGPKKVGHRFTGGTISWVFTRQPRGRAFVVPKRERRYLGRVLFARTVQPDPTRPDRIAFMLVKLAPRRFGLKAPTKPVHCFSSLQPLQRLSGW